MSLFLASKDKDVSNNSERRSLRKIISSSGGRENITVNLPITRIIPNMVTLAALCLSMSSIRLSIQGNFAMATAFIIIACFLDGLDGRLARLLNASSKFGEQLDSLADFFNFGFAPAFVIYLWSGQFSDIRGLGWAFTLFFTICMALRLARFNVGLEDDGEEENPLRKYFFQGIPAPCGAGIIILPLIMSIQFGSEYFFAKPIFVIIFGISVAILMISTVPTFSLKKIYIKGDYQSLILAICALFIIGIILEPWLTLLVLGILYILSIPFSVVVFFRIKNKMQHE